jgi:hypothetical protein
MDNPKNGDIPRFYQERKEACALLADGLRRFEPVFWHEDLVFQGLNPSERMQIEEYCREHCKMRLCFAPHAKYNDKDVWNSRFFQFRIRGKEDIDYDRDWNPFNTYTVRQCDACWTFDLTQVPNPYVVIRPKAKQDLHLASNGIIIISKSLWQEVKNVLNPWVRLGNVAYSDAPGEPVDELLYIMPTQRLGSYASMKILDSCGKCGRPTRIATGDPPDPIMHTMIILKDLPKEDIPIALPGNWFGAFTPGRQPSVSWRAFISNEFHERLRKMKVKGFVAADRPIYTLAEAERLFSPNQTPAET